MALMNKKLSFLGFALLFLLRFCCGCLHSEREALLRINAALQAETFYQWENGTDCCDWPGISCNNVTYHVVTVILTDLAFAEIVPAVGLIGGSIIWQNLCTLTSLEFIDLSENGIPGTLPPCLGKLSSLTYLDLSGNMLTGNIPISLGNMSSLDVLRLYDNNLEGETVLSNICMLTSLSELHFGQNELNGSIPSCLGTLSSLNSLSLFNNHLSGNIPDSLGNLSSLTVLYLSNNSLSGGIPNSLGNLSSLQTLDVSYNQLNGSLPSFSRLSSLSRLYAEANAFALTALPSSLEFLYITLNGHQIISEDFFEGLTKLVDLSLSNCVLNTSATWIPSFQLDTLHITSCKIDDQIPSWISTQVSLSDLQLTDSNLVGEIPSWLMDMSLMNINLTTNHLEGHLLLNTSAQRNLHTLDVSHNALSGQLQSIWLPTIKLLLLNDNFLTGNIPPNLQFGPSLKMLDLANNQLNGLIPQSLANCSELQMLNLGDNDLVGTIPYEFGELRKLQSLVIKNNHLNGSLPLSISNWTELYFLDVGKNLLKGHIPKSVGKFSQLRVLTMRENNFEGSIPAEIGHLKQLQILDLSSNFLSGSIPRSILHLQAMMTEPRQEFSTPMSDITATSPMSPMSPMSDSGYLSYVYKNELNMYSKGRDENYTYIYPDMVSIELSDNQLTGDIPSDLGKLNGLKLLNLSMNNLNGTIPNSIVNMTWLETLDLSTNHLSGSIPPNLGSLSYLGALNLSNNSLSGNIPQGGHMTTFTKSSYLGNPNLWGCPLQKRCSWPEFVAAPPPVSTYINEEEQSEEYLWYMIGLGLSYGMGFAAVVLIIVLKKKWGQKYFQGVDFALKFIFPWLRNLTL